MSHFNETANEWDTPDKIESSKLFARKIKEHIKTFDKPVDILDFGCGTGLIAYEFIDQAKKLVGIDTSEGMLEVFKQKGEGLGKVETHLINLEESDLEDQKFDLIVTSTAFHHLDDPQKMVHKLYGMLNDGGQLAVVDLDKEDGSFHPDNKRMGVKHFGFSEEEVMAWGEKGGFSSTKRYLIHSFEKNEREYPLFLAVFEKH